MRTFSFLLLFDVRVISAVIVEKWLSLNNLQWDVGKTEDLYVISV